MLNQELKFRCGLASHVVRMMKCLRAFGSTQMGKIALRETERALTENQRSTKPLLIRSVKPYRLLFNGCI